MKTFFISYDLWDLVDNGLPEYDTQEGRIIANQKNEMKENRKKDAKALFYIQQAPDETISTYGCSKRREKIFNLMSNQHF